MLSEFGNKQEMEKTMTIQNLIDNLNDQNIKTWFDLVQFLRKLNKKTINEKFEGNFGNFKKHIDSGGIAFVTFSYGVDGVTVEICKYIKTLQTIFNNIAIHIIGSEFSETCDQEIKEKHKSLIVPEIAGFAKWDLFQYFFKTKIEKDGKIYKELLTKFWKEILIITEKIGSYLIKNNISLLFLVNTNSNPGNVSLALSLVILSEYLHLPVISNNHDFYWEGGSSNNKSHKHGPRDHYFTNDDLEEIFTIIKMIYPWKSKNWFLLNINHEQSRILIDKFHFNPKQVGEIGTAIETDKFKPLKSMKRKKEILKQISDILSNYEKKLKSISIQKILTTKKLIENPHPFITGYSDCCIDDITEKDIIFLQATRLIERKKIEVIFTLMIKIFEYLDKHNILENKQINNFYIIITGPILTGHEKYFYSILEHFQQMFEKIKPIYKEHIFLGFLFSEFNKSSFTKKYKNPLSIYDIFRISSLVTLPSETEGRGLPIIEAAACEVPIFTRRYFPEQVYAHLIGEHLPEKYLLNVVEFVDTIDNNVADKLVEYLFSNENDLLKHNRWIIRKRYGFKLLKIEFERILYKLFLQLSS